MIFIGLIYCYTIGSCSKSVERGWTNYGKRAGFHRTRFFLHCTKLQRPRDELGCGLLCTVHKDSHYVSSRTTTYGSYSLVQNGLQNSSAISGSADFKTFRWTIPWTIRISGWSILKQRLSKQIIQFMVGGQFPVYPSWSHLLIIMPAVHYIIPGFSWPWKL